MSLLLFGCSNATTPAPLAPTALPGTTVPRPAANFKPDPSKTPVAILGLTIEPNGHETVLVSNISDQDQPIGLWSVFNQRTETHFDFPKDFVLKPQQTVRVHSGPGSVDNPPNDFLWSTERQWTEQQEDVILLNRQSRIVYWFVASN